MASNMVGGDYTYALEMSAENSWAGDVSARSARTQVMNSENLGTYQRPLHVFKYMHIHEFMKGRSQYGAGNPGTLGAGAQVRDGKRALHLTSKTEEDDNDALESASKDKEHNRRSKGRSKQAQVAQHEEAGAAIRREGESAAAGPPLEHDFLNKGYYVWEAVRREWRGTAEEVAAARARTAADGREAWEVEELEMELEEDTDSFSKPVPLPLLVEVLDELWQDVRTL